ncbi:LysR family transcriptional regulator [Marinibaculum pumilum]|uniref:LysR family transcriptional regulator n=1 Tax=Marinibaculum pumilum TaxID=1766165 RepID=A0ABV7L2G3_9PROT
MLNLTHVRTFLTVLEQGGLRAAARLLDLSPSTVLEHVRQLEAELAAPLLARGRRPVLPTVQGAAFRPLAQALLATEARARAQLAGAALQLAAASNIGTYMLQAPLAGFRDRDGREVDLWIGANPAVADRLERGAADLALMEWWDDRPGFTAQAWRVEPLVLIVAPGHPWAVRGRIAPAELPTMPLLGGEAGTGTGRLLRERLGDLADGLRTVGGFGSTEAVKRAVRAGRGASLVLAATVADELAAGSLAAVALDGPPLAKKTRLVLPQDLPETAPAARLAAHLLDRTGSTPGETGPAVS